jgi:hypothetical protein
MSNGQSPDDTELGECTTVNCRADATTRLRIESDYESVAGETKTTVLNMSYCGEHADMWLDQNRIDDRRYEVLDGGAGR